MKSLKIEIPKGFEIDCFDADSGLVKFREIPKNIFDKIKSIEDVYQDNEEFIKEEYDLSVSDFIDSFKYLIKDEIAYRQMKLICNTFNEGWEPDWTNSNEHKYFQYFYMGEKSGSSGFRFGADGRWLTLSRVGSRLCFKSHELAKHTAELFEDIYKNFHYKNL